MPTPPGRVARPAREDVDEDPDGDPTSIRFALLELDGETSAPLKPVMLPPALHGQHVGTFTNPPAPPRSRHPTPAGEVPLGPAEVCRLVDMLPPLSTLPEPLVEVLPPRAWVPTTSGEILEGAFVKMMPYVGRFGPFQVLLIDTPQGPQVAGGVKLIQLANAAQLYAGQHVRITFKGVVDTAPDRHMRDYAMRVKRAKGDPR